VRLLQVALWTMAAGALVAVPAAARTAREATGQTAADALASANVTAAEPVPAQTSPAQFLGLDSEVVFSTESTPWDVLLGTATTAKALVVVDTPCAKNEGVIHDFAVYGLDADGTFLQPVGDQEVTLSTQNNVAATKGGSLPSSSQDLVVDRPKWPLDQDRDGANTGPCVLKLQTTVSSSDPPSGWLSLGNSSLVALEAGTLMPYRVARGSSWPTFLFVTLLSIAVGLLGVHRFAGSDQIMPTNGKNRWCGLKSKRSQSFDAPNDHPLRGSWVSTAAAVGAVATTLLAASGALGELIPQYQTGKVIIGNILVLAALALAAALVTAGSDGQQLTIKYAAAAVFVAVTAVAAQLLLAGVVLMHASIYLPVQSLALAAAIGVAAIVAVSAKACGRSPGTATSPEPVPEVVGPAVREAVATALVEKGVELGLLGRRIEEIGVYDQLIERCGDDPTPAVREQVAKALYHKGVTLGLLGRRIEEIGVYDQLIKQFGDDPERRLLKFVSVARQLTSGLVASVKTATMTYGQDGVVVDYWIRDTGGQGCDTDPAPAVTPVASANVTASPTSIEFSQSECRGGVKKTITFQGTQAGTYDITHELSCTLKGGPNRTLTNNADFTLVVEKAAGSVSIGNLPAEGEVGGGFVPTYTTNSGGATSSTALTPSVCTVIKGTVFFVGVGMCTVQASISEGTNHLAATGDPQSSEITAPAGGELTITRFQQPVTDGWNEMKGGRTVPLKFRIFDGDTEITDTDAVDSFRAIRVTCGTNEAVDPQGAQSIDALTSTSGKTELRYADGSFIQNWKTDRVSEDTRYRVRVTAEGGLYAEAFFKLKK
jgi:hypothetical protein